MNRKEKTVLLLLAITLITIMEAFLSISHEWIKTKLPESCVTDSLQIITRPFTKILEENISLNDFLLSLDSLLMDLVILMAFFQWALKPTGTWMPALILYYLVRGMCFIFSQWPLLQPYLFFFSYPSLFIPEAATNDLFFSGHTGICCVIMFDCFYTDKKKSFIFSFLVFLFTIFILFVSGGHYSNDIYTAMYVAFFVYKTGIIYWRNFIYFVLFLYCWVFSKFVYKKKNLTNKEKRDLETSLHLD